MARVIIGIGLVLLFSFVKPQSIFAEDQSVKILIRGSGIYVVSSTEIEAAGFNLIGIDPLKIKITNRGNEIPILIENKENSGFSPNITDLM